MAPAPAVALAPATDETAQSAAIVERFLVASMVPDPQTAALYIADDLKITFTGGRKYSHPRETTAFNAGRYKWVKKKMERTDVVPGSGETIVYNLGTLYGEWPDGTKTVIVRQADGMHFCPEPEILAIDGNWYCPVPMPGATRYAMAIGGPVLRDFGLSGRSP